MNVTASLFTQFLFQHLGLEVEPKRSTLSYANAHRPWELYERLFYDLLTQCQAISPKKKFRFKNRLLTMATRVIQHHASFGFSIFPLLLASTF